VIQTVIAKKLVRLLWYSAGSLVCFGTAVISSGLLYRETVVLNVVAFLFLTLSGTAGGFYLYMRTLRELSPKPGRFSSMHRHRP
jgi:drug/metabolite transporter (DMT)-like permease